MTDSKSLPPCAEIEDRMLQVLRAELAEMTEHLNQEGAGVNEAAIRLRMAWIEKQMAAVRAERASPRSLLDELTEKYGRSMVTAEVRKETRLGEVALRQLRKNGVLPALWEGRGASTVYSTRVVAAFLAGERHPSKNNDDMVLAASS